MKKLMKRSALWAGSHRVLLGILSAALAFSISAASGAQPATQDPSEAGREAFAALRQGDYPRVIELLEPLRDRPDTSSMELALLGTVYVEVGRPNDALAVLGPLAREGSADAAVLFNAGRAALAIGDEAQAEGYLERSLALQPASPAERELGLLRGRQGRIAEAYRWLRPWALDNQNDLEARSAAVACALSLGRVSEIDPLIEGLPKDQPRTALLWGQLLAQRGEPAEAIEVLEPFLDNHPPEMTVDLVPLIGDLYIQVGRAADTVKLLEGQSVLPPRASLVFADALYRTGDLERAVKALESHALAIEKGESRFPMRPATAAQISLEYGRMLVALGRHEEAIPHLERATEMTPSEGLAWKSLGEALVGVGRRDEAKVALQRFRDLRQGHAERRQEAEAAAADPVIKSMLEAQKALEAGNEDEALRILRQEAVLSPQDLRPRISEVRLFLGLRRLDEAEQAAQAALEAFPGHPDALYLLGVVRMAQRRVGDAEAIYREVISRMPEHVAAMSDLAVILMERGDEEEARGLLEKVLEIHPEDETARQNLERLGD